MTSTVEVTPARKHSRTRFLALIPLVPALVALAVVAVVPMSSASADTVSQSLPGTVLQPAAAPVRATPAVTASPSPAAAAAAIFSAPPITVLPPPPPPPPAAKKSYGTTGSSSKSSAHVVASGRCSAGGITVRSVSSAPNASYEQQNFGLINADRQGAGVADLAWSAGLANTARAWATYLADNNCTGAEIGHSTMWTNGENVYWISGGSGSAIADRANTAFMNSTGHRANLLRPTFHSVGVGIAHGAGGWYVVQDFAN